MNLDQWIAGLPDTASALEWICTSLGVICLIAGLVGVWQAVGDRTYARQGERPRWPIRSIIARGHVRHEVINVALQGGFLTLELWALVIPDPINPSVALLAWATQIVFTAMQLLLTYNSLADRYDRARIMRAVQVSLKERGRDAV